MRKILLPLLLFTAGVAAHQADADPGAPTTESVEFSRDIRPILSDACFKCHGPDAEQRVSDLRLDTKDGALAEYDGIRVIVPGDTSASELVRRITSADTEERMPPPDSGRTLTDQQIALVKDWIGQGAVWQQHWAFIAPKRPTLPQTGATRWRRNEIDDFVLARLEQEGLEPSREADKPALIRRVSLDLTGLPPSIAEVDAFLADSSPAAYERVVDRLLASPRYGERMAIQWLDAARYADTSGYQTDGPRYMWRWRDWVIDALNENVPFDRFTIQQIAGDMLPPADNAHLEAAPEHKPLSGEIIRDPVRLDRLIASAFHRNHRGNAEGGIIPEEYQVEYVVDRVETTSTVWLGLTFGCCRCHDHKYDPLSQEEFYRFFAYFNNVPEYGRAIKEGNSPPYIKAPTPEQLARLEQLDTELAQAEGLVEDLQEELEARQAEWEQSLDISKVEDRGKAEDSDKVEDGGKAEDWTPTKGLLSYFPFNGDAADRGGDNRVGKFIDGGEAFIQGRLDQAARLADGVFVEAGDVGNFGYFDKFTLAAWIYPEAATGSIVSRMVPEARAKGYYVNLEDGHVQVNLVVRWLDDSIRVQTEKQLATDQWHHVAVTYDGSRVVEGISVYIDGRPESLQTNQPFINQTFTVEEPLRIGGGHSDFSGAIDDVRVYERDLSAEEVAALSVAESISEIVAIRPDERSPEQSSKLQSCFVEQHAPQLIRTGHEELVRVRQLRREFIEGIPTLMVMQELPGLRETHILTRGQYDQPGKEVSPGVPAIFPPLPADAPNNRLGLARWLVDPANPLTARVAVNRMWQTVFGTGLVKTPEDFGVQGERPSHPELLDWLATELMRTGWDMKAMHKLIVMSGTYRQSSKVTPKLLTRDPENRLLARGPRFRLSAEMVRDQALAISGLLTEKRGGPSVLPYQPEGLWKEIASDTEYDQSHGDDLYRRSLYTFWKRTVAPPSMVTLDATARETCTVRRARTNTPLQALVLMNEVTFVEAARALAERAVRDGGGEPETRIRYAFRLATARQPSRVEGQVLANSFHYYRNEFSQDPEAAKQLLSTGEFPRDPELNVADLAGYTMVASMILNLDELTTKE